MPEQPSLDLFEIGWICALRTEYEAAVLMLDEDFGRPAQMPPDDSNMYRLGKIGTHHVVITLLSQYGTTSAAVSITHMVRTFSTSLRFGLMVGVGGGIPSPPKVDIRLGDVVVSYPEGTSPGVVQYDMGKDTGEFKAVGVLHKPPRLLLSTAASMGIGEEKYQFLVHLKDALEDAEKREVFGRPDPSTDRLFKANYNHPVDADDCMDCLAEEEVPRKERANDKPRVHYGTIASGNLLIKSGKKRDQLRRQTKGALCFEMEAAGIMRDFPCLAVRGICDYSDSHKNNEWQSYAALVAASFTKELVRSLPASEVSQQLLVKEVCSSIKALNEEAKAINERLDRTYEQQERHHSQQTAKALSDEQEQCHQALKVSRYEEHKDVNPQAAAGTCQWVLKSENYYFWRYSFHRNLLWISADPGCGKSVLAKSLIDTHLDTADSPASVCYFFFKDNKDQDSLAPALCSILHQLFTQQPNLVQHAMASWKINGERLRDETFELWRILMTAASDPALQTTICVLDALDECCEEDQARLLQRLRDFHNNPPLSSQAAKFKFLVTSRPYIEIQNKLRGITQAFPHVRIQDAENSEDIRKEIMTVVESKVQDLAKTMDLSPDMQQQLKKELSRTEHRTYLWLHLAIEYIRDVLETSLVPETEHIPSLPSSVNEVYAKLLDRVKERDVPRVRRIFQIIVAARRPLSTLEMGMALGISECDNSPTRTDAGIDEEAIRQKIRQLCALFVFIRDDTIYLIHQTAREFLLQNKHTYNLTSSFFFTLTDAETLLAQICVRYLSLDEDQTQYTTSTNWGCLVEYSACHWADHVRRMSLSLRIDLEAAIYTLYAARIQTWCSRFWETVIPYEHVPHPPFETVVASHIAAFNGHTNVLRKLISEGKETAYEADDFGATPLIWSSWSGHYETSEWLVKEKADVNAVSQRYGAPLLVAALKGHKNIVQLLLENGADVNQHSGERGQAQAEYSRKPEDIYLCTHTGTALWAASLMGHCDVVQLLLYNGAAGIDFALMSASRGGHLDVVQFLIENGADPNAEDEESFYGTAVQAAALGGHLDILRFLFDKGVADISGVGYFDSALRAAANNGYGEIVKFLLEHRAHSDYEDYEYMDALHYACLKNDLQAVEALAHLVADINGPIDYSKKTALQVACLHGDHELVRVLLDNGAGAPGDNSLLEAASYGDAQLIKALIENGADIQLDNPLAEAARCGRVHAVGLLLEEGANIDMGNPLAKAAGNGHAQIVEMLIEKGANVNLGYPLHAAARKNHCEVVQILLRNGADVNARLLDETALDVARDLGHFTIVMHILQTGNYIAPGRRHSFSDYHSGTPGRDGVNNVN